jgi:hypothetical protein
MNKINKVKKVSLVALVTFFTLVTSFTVFATDSTLKFIEKEAFPKEENIKCRFCGFINPSSTKYCGNCGALLISEEIMGYLLIKGGGFIPLNSDLRDTYGAGIFYGVGLDIEYNFLGVGLEFGNVTLESLVPLTTVNNSTPVEGDWRNTNTKFSITPAFLSLYVNHSIKEWKGYLGIGIGIAMVREEFKGDYYFKKEPTSSPDWGYAAITKKENLLAYEIFLGIVKSEKIGFELKYSIIPTLNKFSFSDLGGLSTSISIFF